MPSCNCCTTYSAPDLMDGGVTAALIEKEAAGSYTRTDEEGWRARAEKAGRERDEARREAREWQRDALNEVQNHRIVRNELDRLRAEQPRPLTADDLSDEAIRRARVAWLENAQNKGIPSAPTIRAMFAAALAEPTRPEGAEELARLIAQADVGEWDCGDLADALLATGRVRVVTEEQP